MHDRIATIGATALLVACGQPKLCPTQVSVVDPSTFTVVPEADDPFETTTSTSSIRCTADDTLIEDLGDGEVTFSLNTFNCNRVTMEAPLTMDLLAGETAQLRIWHFALFPYGQTEALVAVGLEEATIWSQTIPLPTESDLLVAEIPMTRMLAAGERVRWHVSNHGSNSWNFVDLSVTRDRACLNDEHSPP